MSETDLSRAITKALTQLGHIVVRVHSGKVRAVAPGAKWPQRAKGLHWLQLADKGTPDRVVLSPNGLTTWLEVKTPKGRLSPEQVRWHERAKKGGHRVAVVRSVTEALQAVSLDPRYFEVDRSEMGPIGHVPR